MPDVIAETPSPPYWAAIFTSQRTAGDNGYAAMAARMMELAARQPGFLGVESARERIGITVSYWQSLDAIAAWKAHAEHTLARETGRTTWYHSYTVRICRVEREYHFANPPAQNEDESLAASRLWTARNAMPPESLDVKALIETDHDR